jgi:hypothetical protein
MFSSDRGMSIHADGLAMRETDLYFDDRRRRRHCDSIVSRGL